MIIFSKKVHLLLFIIFVSSILFSKIILSNNFFYIIFFIILVSYIFLMLYFHNSKNIEFYIFIPFLISTVQNIYLGMNINYITGIELKLLLSLHMLLLYSLFFNYYILFPIKNKYYFNFFKYMLLLLIVHSLVLFIFKGANTMAFLASLRNIMSPFVFFMLGYIVSNKININNYFKLVIYLGYFIIFFGLLELFIIQDLWLSLNISDLWLKKDLNIQEHGFPGNFYGKESGEYVRRMVSTFADPVNLGTAMFMILMISWLKKYYFLMFLSFISVILIISKGALLGILIFIWIYIKNKFHILFSYISAVILISLGLAFVYISFLNNSMSLFLHFSGFISSLTELPNNLLGRGVGNIGVLATQLSKVTFETGITESGLGLIIGQLGIIGLLIYLLFFSSLLKHTKFIEDIRIKIFLQTTILSIFFNIIFNEVALSPNSSGIYFTIFGIFFASKKINKIQGKT